MERHLERMLSIVRIRHALRMRLDGRSARTDDDDWVTINGTHVLIDKETGEMIGGPEKLRAVSDPAKGTKAVHSRILARTKAKCEELRPKMEKTNTEERRNRTYREFAENDVLKAREHEKLCKRNFDFAKKMYEENGQPDRPKEEVLKEFNQAREEARREYQWIRENRWKENTTQDDMFKHERAMEKASKIADKAESVLRTRENYENAKQNYDRAVTLRGKREADLEAVKNRGLSEEDQKIADEYNKAAEQRNASILKMYKSPDDCKTSQEATDYLRAQGYYDHGNGHFDADSRVDLDKMSNGSAIETAKHIDSLMKDYPGLRGQLDGVDCHDMSHEYDCANTLAYAAGTRICYNEKYYGEGGSGPKSYDRDVNKGFHPKGTGFGSVVDHETAHAIAAIIRKRAAQYGLELDDGNVENTVMRRVQENLYGKYSKVREKEVRAAISRYAANNKGVRLSSDGRSARENKEYGRNTEFLAEGMAEARGSNDPGEIARETKKVLEDMMRRVKLI